MAAVAIRTTQVQVSLIRFIFSKQFIVNIILAMVLGAVAVVGLYFWLGSYTEHDITVSTPDFTGVPINEIEAFADTTDVTWEIVDSLYADDIPKGTVAEQEPKPGYKVKRGRMVYLTVNAVLPKQVTIPNVKNLSLRQAKAVLESVGLKLGELQYRPDIAKNAVLEQLVKGRSVKPEQMAVMGTVVDLVLGDGLSNTRVPIPYLQYYTLEEATERLNLASLNLGTFRIDTPVVDSALARVYRQIPAFDEKNLVPMGTSFILYLTNDTLGIEYDSTLYSNPMLMDSVLTEEDFNDKDFDQ
ncbi:MAG: PASTA domain-containing protein [Flavobacteriales bacterium]|nr:PASTA domain-containing protein [Flavobacteriales bacterium]